MSVPVFFFRFPFRFDLLGISLLQVFPFTSPPDIMPTYRNEMPFAVEIGSISIPRWGGPTLPDWLALSRSKGPWFLIGRLHRD